MIKELWFDVPGYDGEYQVSNNHMVRTFKYGGNGRILKIKNGPRKKGDEVNRYQYVTLCRQGVRVNYLIHRLVAEMFIPNPYNKREVNHKNGLRNDNRIENLEWCTRRENSKHAYDIGLISGKKGSENPMCRLRPTDILEIRAMYESKVKSVKEIAATYKISPSYVYEILNKVTWKHV